MRFQGRAFGGLAFLRSLVNVTAPFLTSWIWGETVDTLVGTCFFFFSSLSAVAILITIPLGCTLSAREEAVLCETEALADATLARLDADSLHSPRVAQALSLPPLGLAVALVGEIDAGGVAGGVERDE